MNRFKGLIAVFVAVLGWVIIIDMEAQKCRLIEETPKKQEVVTVLTWPSRGLHLKYTSHHPVILVEDRKAENKGGTK